MVSQFVKRGEMDTDEEARPQYITSSPAPINVGASVVPTHLIPSRCPLILGLIGSVAQQLVSS